MKIDDKFLALFTGIILSIVSAYYAIVGLTIIFSAAFWPIIIMGSTLEIGKIITASYLYRNWSVIPFLMKSYFTAAVAILMFITSMGVFGFLSKAHIDQDLSSGDVQSKVEVLDSKIQREKERIVSNVSALKQLDSAVNKIIAEKDAEQGLRYRKNQEKERKSISSEIKDSQKNIDDFQTERLPLAKEIRIAEREVGPIRYVAELIYGESNKEILEKSVRFMIISLVLVLDPLALLLIISANINYSLKSKNINFSKRYSLDMKKWFKSNANAVATDGKNWTEMPDVTVTKTKK
jgi:esterase/lipase